MKKVFTLFLLFSSLAFADSRTVPADIFQLNMTGNSVSLQAPSVITSYNLSLPTAQASAGACLVNDGFGSLSWAADATATHVLFGGTPPAFGAITTSALPGPASLSVSGYLSSTDWTTFNAKQAAISAAAPITFSASTVGITQAATAANGYLSSTDWNTFNGKQQAITVGPISGSSNANGATLSAGTLALTPADATNGGAVTNGVQSLLGAKTLLNNLTLSANAIFPITLDSSTTGANANLFHATEITRLTNASLTSIATLDTLTSVSGFQALVINATGARITLVNNFGSPPANSAVILTATGANTTIPDKGTVGFTYSSTANAWYVTDVNRGVQQLADGGTGAITKTAAFDALSPMTAAGDTIYGGASGTGTRLAAGSATQLLHGGTTPSWAGVSLTADVSGVLPTGNMAGPAATATSGFLSSTDWNTFNGKQAAISATAPVTFSANTVAMTQAATAANGYLSSTDWNTFNGKAPSTRNIATTAPITGGGDLSADRTIAITQAATAANGYLSSTDWNTFNTKTTNPMTTTGDMIYASNTATPATPARVGIGGANTVLHGGASAPAFSAVVSADFSGQLSAAKGGTGADLSGATGALFVTAGAFGSVSIDTAWTDFSGTVTISNGCSATTVQLARWMRINPKLVHVQIVHTCTGAANVYTVSLPFTADIPNTMLVAGQVGTGYNGTTPLFPLITSGDLTHLRVAQQSSALAGVNGSAFTTTATTVTIDAMVSI